MKRKIICAVILTMSVLALTGCKKKNEQTVQPETQIQTEALPVAETETQENGATHEGEVRSFYTGEWIDEKLAWKRPVAVMTENTHVTLPQYGVGNADVIYECPVEGGITRMMAIYQDFESLEKVGNVRSCRLYYVYFAKEFDAVYFHAGESKYALDVLNSSFIDNVDGITGKGVGIIIVITAEGHHITCIQREKIWLPQLKIMAIPLLFQKITRHIINSQQKKLKIC